MLLCKFRHCTHDVKKNLFMTYCSSLYCCSIWSAYDNSHLRSIHVAHNDVPRVMFHLPQHTRASNIFVKQNIPNFPVLRRKLVYSMYKWGLTSSNSLVQALVDSNFFFWRLRYLRSGWKFFLNSWQYNFSFVLTVFCKCVLTSYFSMDYCLQIKPFNLSIVTMTYCIYSASYSGEWWYVLKRQICI